MEDVKRFGAIGDGRKDDTEALRKAVRECGGFLRFPAGEYRITGTLEAVLPERGRIAINGSGGAAKIIMDGPGPAILIKGSHEGSADPGGFAPEHWLRERMPVAGDIEIEGRHPGSDGIVLEGVMQPTLSGLLIREVNTAVCIRGRARNVLIERCHLYHNRNAGIHLYRLNLHQVSISGSHISYNLRGGIVVEESEIRNLQITGNDIEYNNHRTHPSPGDPSGSADVLIDARRGTVREGTIVSNTIQATPSRGGASVRFIGPGPGRNIDTGLFAVTGNLIGSQETNLHLASACGITVSGNSIFGASGWNILAEDSRNIVVSANVFDHPAYHAALALRAGVRFARCSNCVISGSVLQDCRPEPPDEERLKGLMELEGCRRMNISCMQVLDGSPYGIFLDDCSDTMVSGCTVLDGRKPARMKAPVFWGGAGSGNMARGNRLGAAGEEAVPRTAGVVLSGNLYDGDSRE